jgi:hypothetical protein
VIAGIAVVSACSTSSENGGSDAKGFPGFQQPVTVEPAPADQPTDAAPVATRKVTIILKDGSAKALFGILNGKKQGNKNSVQGKGTITCDLQVSQIPAGAQGIAAPSASCLGFPEVHFPAGAQGLVLPWFSALNGLAGFDLWSKMDVEADDQGLKSIAGTWDVSCTKSKCTLAGEVEVRKMTATIDGSAAKALNQQLQTQEIRGVKKLEAEASMFCALQISQIPAGAQGIAAPSANCSATPKVEFPAGAQGLVPLLFSLRGLDGFQLYSAMKGVEPSAENVKTFQGKLRILCKGAADAKVCTLEQI